MKRIGYSHFLLATAAFGFAGGCAGNQDSTQPSSAASQSAEASNVPVTQENQAVPDLIDEPDTKGPILLIPLEAKSGSEVDGEVRFAETTEGVQVRLVLRNAGPGLHGVHIHEKADCSAPDAKSAGGHYNPNDDPHGIPGKTEHHHVGDLGNIVIDSTTREGELEAQVRFADLSDSEDATLSLRGRALIVHEKPDVGEQPAGNAGARIACAEITSEAAAHVETTGDTSVDDG